MIEDIVGGIMIHCPNCGSARVQAVVNGYNGPIEFFIDYDDHINVISGEEITYSDIIGEELRCHCYRCDYKFIDEVEYYDC